MRPPQRGHAPVPRCQDVGGLRQGPCRRCSKCSLLPLRHSTWEGEESPLRRAGLCAVFQGPALDRGLPLRNPVQARQCRPPRRGIQECEEPWRRIPLLAPNHKSASPQQPITCLITYFLSIATTSIYRSFTIGTPYVYAIN